MAVCTVGHLKTKLPKLCRTGYGTAGLLSCGCRSEILVLSLMAGLLDLLIPYDWLLVSHKKQFRMFGVRQERGKATGCRLSRIGRRIRELFWVLSSKRRAPSRTLGERSETDSSNPQQLLIGFPLYCSVKLP